MWEVLSSSRSSSATRQPSSPGIITSSRITSGSSARAFSSPVGPSAASSTSMPSASRLTRQRSRIGASSSITSTLMPMERLCLHRRKSHTILGDGEDEGEPRALALVGVDPDPAAHLLHEALGDEEPEPGAAPLGVARLVELREDPLALRGGHTRSLVDDRDL